MTSPKQGTLLLSLICYNNLGQFNYPLSILAKITMKIFVDSDVMYNLFFFHFYICILVNTNKMLCSFYINWA